MTKKVSYVTKEGLKKLQDELDNLQNVERPKISKAIGEAIEKGDISENAEYDAAKDEQRDIEARIFVTPIQQWHMQHIKNIKTKATMTYTLVSESEADFKAGKLSITTPIAKALIGKKLGDKVEVQVPAGTMEFEIMDISI